MHAAAAALGGSRAPTAITNPLTAASARAASGSPAGGFSLASKFAGKLKRSVKKIEEAAVVVSRARALERVDKTHPRVPGTVRRVIVTEPMYKKNSETGKLEKVMLSKAGRQSTQ